MPDEPRSTAEHYHQQTKYTPFNLGGKQPDWENAPDKFKRVDGAKLISLRDRLPFKSGQIYVGSPNEEAVGPPSLDAISRILFCTYGVTAIGAVGGAREFFRASPSAGALYPTDVYLLVRSHPELEAGVYYFSPIEHALSPVVTSPDDAEGERIWELLAAASRDNAAVKASEVVVALSCTLWRSQWRYHQRGYRRCLLDTGHVLGNLCAYAPIEGYQAWPVGGFDDLAMEPILKTHHGDDEVLCLVPLLDTTVTVDGRSAPNVLPSSFFAEVDKASEEGLMFSVSLATSLDRHDALRPREAYLPMGPDWTAIEAARRDSSVFSEEPPPLREALMPTILRRRSTRQMTGGTLSSVEIGGLLEYAYRYDLAASVEAREVPAFFVPELVDTWVVVNHADDLPSGVYRYLPADRRLILMEEGDHRTTIKHICLGQDLASQAAAVVIHTANLPKAVGRLGNRAYRYLHLDAGHLGQRLNLLAVAGGLGVSGIGGFIDDDVNQLLGLTSDHICLYLTCLGRSADTPIG